MEDISIPADKVEQADFVSTSYNALRALGLNLSMSEVHERLNRAIEADPKAHRAFVRHMIQPHQDEKAQESVALFLGRDFPEYLDCRGFKRHFFEGKFPRSAKYKWLNPIGRALAMFKAWWDLSLYRAQKFGYPQTVEFDPMCFMCGEPTVETYCSLECRAFDQSRHDKYEFVE
jgi:hypothetical protein